MARAFVGLAVCLPPRGVWISRPAVAPREEGAKSGCGQYAFREEPLPDARKECNVAGLEALLDALAQLDYPINPQIYHQGMAVYRHRNGHEDCEPVTIVDFPAYATWFADVRRVLSLYDFDPGCVHVSAMLDELHGEQGFRPAPDFFAPPNGASWSQ